MAEVQQNDSGGKKKKGAQKKMTIRVDFTPMVDMNMLLITFFMLCTTMIKSQTLNINLPSNEKVDNPEQMNQASETDAVTIIIDAKRKPGTDEVDSVNHHVVNEIYYYFGQAGGEAGIEGPNGAILSQNNNLQLTELLSTETSASGAKTYRGIRKIIRERNKQVIEQIEALREKYIQQGNGKMRDQDRAKFEAEATAIRRNDKLTRPVIIIKSTPQASYGALVSVLDEMQINNIARYQIDNMTHADTLLLQDYWRTHSK